jgi:uncharacterized delta-60 repeat protein
MTSACGAVLAILLTVATQPAKADDGAPDPQFNGNGRVALAAGTSATAEAVAVQPDGKVVAAGSAQVPTPGNPGNVAFVVARWNADGTPDTSFGPLHDGVAFVDFDLGGPQTANFDAAKSVALQADGCVVVAGDVRASGVEAQVGVARLTPTGQLDVSFGEGGKAVFAVSGTGGAGFFPTVLVRRSGAIVITLDSLTGEHGLLQLAASNGELDRFFGFDGRSETWSCGGPGCGHFWKTVETPDGNLMTLGTAGGEPVLARYFGGDGQAGWLDPGFGVGGVATFPRPQSELLSTMGIPDVALDNRGRILVLLPDGSGRAFLLRVVDGQPDRTFGSSGWSSFPFSPSPSVWGLPTALAVQADGKPIVVGTIAAAQGSDFLVTRRTADGSGADPSFAGGWRTIPFDLGGALDEVPGAVALGAGRVVVAGYATTDAGNVVAAARLDNALVWSDGFESGSTWFWETSP